MRHVVMIVLLSICAFAFMIGMSYGTSKVMRQCVSTGHFEGLYERDFNCSERFND